MMKYPEGDEVNVGDVIWTNGGCNIRRVSRVLSNTELLKSEGENEPGIMWVRNINPCSSPDIFGFEAEADFSYEGIGKLTKNELKYVEYLFRTLEIQLGKRIWHNKNLLYYPVFYRLNDAFNWFIFCYDTSTNKETCYEFRENEEKFYILNDKELCRKIRLM